MTYAYSEDGLIEQATQDVLEELGWEVLTAWKKETLGENGLLGRDNHGEVMLKRYVLAALQKFNPNLPKIAYEQAIDILEQKQAGKTLAQINKEKYELLKQGIPVSFNNDEGKLVKKKLKVFDFANYENNHFLAVRQLEVVGELHNRRPDVIGFVNGIPLVFVELKSHREDIQKAYYNNLNDYKDVIPHLFHHNAFIILSNGREAKVGTITAKYKYFLDWKRIEEDEEGEVSLDTLLRGTCAKHRLMDIFENFLLFDNSGGEPQKIMAKNHQFIGVNKVIDNAGNIEDLKGKLGVFWHTQGSGKSYSMVFLCEKIHRKFGGSYTFLIVVDRTELENQLYDTFSGVGIVNDKNIVAGKKTGLTGREHLRELLAENHRYVFTLIHKFSIDPKLETEYPLITERKNIIVISDEAHRTQNGTYAQNMRFNALPNASFLGFTGTPIIKEEEEITKNIFGEYVSVYDFKRAIEDDATLPLRYLNRGDKLGIENPALDAKMAEVFENEELDEDKKKKLAYLFKKEYPILTSEKRLDAIAKDLVRHFNDRGYQGKAMFVALDKPTAVRMYDLIMKYWPQYLAELEQKIKKAADYQEEQELKRKYRRVAETEVCVVVSSEQNEIEKFRKMNLDIETHRRKMVDRNLEKDFKDENHPFRLAIVCAMWITGFDAPCVSTVYLDKPIKGHTLMQTIARANRVYDDEKENGLIVDYGNVYRQLEEAYSIYGEGGKGNSNEKGGGKPVEQLEDLEKELKEGIQEVEAFLQSLDFDLKSVIDAKPMQRLAQINNAIDAICLNETTRTTFEVAARNVFRKYKALFPENQVKKHLNKYNAIRAIYEGMNENVHTADVTEIMLELQQVVNENITVEESEVNEPKQEVFVDLSKLDFDKLKEAFAKKKRKNTLTYNLQQAVQKLLEQMIRENPLRLEFYERYKEIIDDYNNGKDQACMTKAFNQLTDLLADMSEEELRYLKEELPNNETLAVFDLLISGKKLSKKEREQVKNVAQETLDTLKAEKLKIDRWRESRQITAQVKSTIYEKLLWLPQESYTDEDVSQRTLDVYQHIFTNYYGGDMSAYNNRVA